MSARAHQWLPSSSQITREFGRSSQHEVSIGDSESARSSSGPAVTAEFGRASSQNRPSVSRHEVSCGCASPSSSLPEEGPAIATEVGRTSAQNLPSVSQYEVSVDDSEKACGCSGPAITRASSQTRPSVSQHGVSYGSSGPAVTTEFGCASPSASLREQGVDDSSGPAIATEVGRTSAQNLPSVSQYEVSVDDSDDACGYSGPAITTEFGRTTLQNRLSAPRHEVSIGDSDAARSSSGAVTTEFARASLGASLHEEAVDDSDEACVSSGPAVTTEFGRATLQSRSIGEVASLHDGFEAHAPQFGRSAVEVAAVAPGNGSRSEDSCEGEREIQLDDSGLTRRRAVSERSFLARMTLAFVALTALSASAGVENPGWFLRNQVAARINPFGLFDEARLGYRFTFEHAPVRSVGIAANASMSPSFARGGVTLDTQLTSFLTLIATYEAGGSFGNLGLEQSFPSAANAVVHSPDPALMFERSPGAYAAARQQLIVGAQLNASWRALVFKAYCRAVFQHASLRQGDHVFYDANWDVLFPNDGWLTVNDVDLLMQAMPGLRVGLRYNFTHAFIEPGVAGVTTQRIGPLLTYLFFEHPHAVFNAPTISLVVNWRLERPLTATQSPFIPFVGLAFSFRSEL